VRKIREIILHCSATHPGMDIGVAEIRGWHQDRGWSDVGYHFVVRRNGAVETGRKIADVGAHVQGHNQNSIGVCLVGGVNRGNVPDCNFTAPQWSALHDLVSELIDDYPDAQVIGHRSYTTKKDCPVFDAVSWWYGK